MSTGGRVIVQLEEQRARSAELPDEVRAVLASAGIHDARSPHPDVLPGLFVITVPADADVDNLIERLRALDVVRDVARDQFRQAF